MEITKRPSVTSALNVKDTVADEKKPVQDAPAKEEGPTLVERTGEIKNVLKSALEEIEQSQKEFNRISSLLETKLDKMVK